MATIPQQRRALKAEIKRLRREVLPRLKKVVVDSKRDRKKRLVACQKDCRDAMKSAKKRAVIARRKLDVVIARAKERARQTCKSCKVVDERGLADITSSIEALEKERREIEKLRAQASTLISPRGKAGGKRSAELRAESDHDVEVNLGDDAELIELFRKNRAKFKKSKYKTRTEDFLDWLHDHPEELDELRSARQRKYETEAERLFAAREPEIDYGALERCKAELEELKSAERFLEEAESENPF